MSLKEVVLLLRSASDYQEEQIELALLGRSSSWRLLPEYKQQVKNIDRIYQMNKVQRARILKTVNTMSVVGNTSQGEFQIPAEETGLLYPPLNILKDIFDDGSSLLRPDSIIDAPGAPTVKIVKNLNDLTQPFKVTIKNGIISCQQSCDRFKAYACLLYTSDAADE